MWCLAIVIVKEEEKESQELINGTDRVSVLPPVFMEESTEAQPRKGDTQR